MMPDRIAALALALGALALLLLAGALLRRIASGQRSVRTLADALERRSTQPRAPATAPAGAGPPEHATHAAAASASAEARPASGGSGAARAEAGGMRASASVGAGADATTASRAEVQDGLRGGATQPARAGTTQPAGRSRTRLGRMLDRAAQAGANWLDTPVGRHVVAAEDQRLLDQCGFIGARARSLFLIARLGCACVLPLVAGLLAEGHLTGLRYAFALIAALVAGLMVPKMLLQRRGAARRTAVVDELPMLVDLLRLLQGVGLSLDQSMQVTVGEFRRLLPVLSSELEIAQRQFVAGRTREQSLQRLATGFDNEDLRAVVRLLVQVDRHGGAVQEPLRQFGDRLREGRRALLRARIGRLTVKMTGVMVVTLLPALLIVTAGPGVLSVIRALSQSNQVSQHR